MSTDITFSFGKYHGLSNNFIVVDWRNLDDITSTGNPIKARVMAQIEEARKKYPHDMTSIGTSSLIECPISASETLRLCKSDVGIGAEGIMICLPALDNSDDTYLMRMRNNDGTSAEICGNGIRCLSSYLFDMDLASGKVSK